MARKTVDIKIVLDHVNKQLASNIPQTAKAGLCSMIETILMDADVYKGFNYLYWISPNGAIEFFKLKPSERDNEIFDPRGISFSVRERFIIGLDGAADKEEMRAQGKFPHQSTFTSELEGEYSRQYFVHHFLKS